MEDQTPQQEQTTQSPAETQTAETTPVSSEPQSTVDQPANNATPIPAPSEEIQKVPCECKCIHQLGYVEVELADGTKQQMTVQQAQDELTKFENIKQALEGGTQHATE